MEAGLSLPGESARRRLRLAQTVWLACVFSNLSSLALYAHLTTAPRLPPRLILASGRIILPSRSYPRNSSFWFNLERP